MKKLRSLKLMSFLVVLAEISGCTFLLLYPRVDIFSGESPLASDLKSRQFRGLGHGAQVASPADLLAAKGTVPKQGKVAYL
jgi:hypothetical protein